MTSRTVLADTSVWVAHFRQSNPTLVALLRNRRLRMHPFIATELALGSLAQRDQTLTDLRTLPQAPVATQFELDHLIEARRLFARGIGFVDLHLVASALLDSSLALWTLDKRLAEVADQLDIAYKP